MATIISIVNFKGGVGKTTLSVNIAACLAYEYDRNVLLVDLDPQSNTSIWLLTPAKWQILNKQENSKKTSYSLFFGEFNDSYCVTPFNDPMTGVFLPTLKILPASFRMVRLEEQMVKKMNMELIAGKYKKGNEYRYFEKKIDKIADLYDYIIFDCPPNLYGATRNALWTSNYIVIPCVPDSLSTMGLKLLLHELDSFFGKQTESTGEDKFPTVPGIVLTRFRPVNEAAAGITQIIQTFSQWSKKGSKLTSNKSHVLENYPIRDYVVHAEAVTANRPLCHYAASHNAYSDVKAVTQALIEAMEEP